MGKKEFQSVDNYYPLGKHVLHYWDQGKVKLTGGNPIKLAGGSCLMLEE